MALENHRACISHLRRRLTRITYIRLTYCERSQPEHDQAIFQSDDPVLVRGALRIKKLEWLSEDGRRVLEEELRERDTKERRARGAGAALSNLSLTTVFASKLKKRFRVWIQAKKPFPAVFMLCKFQY